MRLEQRLSVCARNLRAETSAPASVLLVVDDQKFVPPGSNAPDVHMARHFSRSFNRMSRDADEPRSAGNRRCDDDHEPLLDPEDIAETAAALVSDRIASSERHIAEALGNLARMIEDGRRRRPDRDRLDEMIADLERRAEASERRTAMALEDIAGMIRADRLGHVETLAPSALPEDPHPFRAAPARREPGSKEGRRCAFMRRTFDEETFDPRSASRRPDGDVAGESARKPRRFDPLLASMQALSRRLDARGAEDGAMGDPQAEIFEDWLENLRRRIDDLAKAGHTDLARRIDELRASVEAQARETEELRADLLQHPEQQLLILRRLETLARETEALARAGQSALDRRIDDLRKGFEELARRIESLHDQRPEQRFALTRQIEALQRKIDDAANAEPPGLALRFGRLDHALGELGRRVDDARAETEQAARSQDLVLREMDALRREVEGLSRLMGDIAPRASVAAIETALHDLAERIDAQRDRGVANQALAPAERIASELWSTLKELDPAPQLHCLDADVKAILHRLDEAKTNGGANAAAMNALARQTAEIKEQLRLLASRPLPVENIETRLIDLSQRVEALHRGATPEAFADLGAAVKSIDAIVSDETRNSCAFNQRLERLADKLDEALGNSGAKRFDELNARLDEMQKSLAQRIGEGAAAQKPATGAALEDLLAALAEKIDGALDAKAQNPAVEELGRTLAARLEEINLAKDGSEIAQFEEIAQRLGDRVDAALAPGASRRDIARLDEQIEQLSHKLDRIALSSQATHIEDLVARSAPPVELNEISRRLDSLQEALAARHDAGAKQRAEAGDRRLVELVEGLARKIDGALASSADSSALAALEGQIRELSARLDRGAVPALGVIERRIAELFESLEAARDEATDAAEAALRKAALEALREAKGAAACFNPAFRQELDELRRTQAENGAHTHETLSVVHETLERVVDRLTEYEEELSELRAAPPPQDEPQFSSPPDRLREGARESASLERVDAKERGPLPEKASTDFIAAARRAAQLAAAETDAQAQRDAIRLAPGDAAHPGQGAAGKGVNGRDALSQMRKRPILLSLATLLVIGAVGGLLGAARYGWTSARGPQPAEKSYASRQPSAATGEQAAQSAAPPAPMQQQALASQQKPPAGAKEVTAQIDDTPTGAINRPPALADETAAIAQAAMRGDAAAQYEYAVRLSEGRGAPMDLKAAAFWFEKAAAQGLAPAQYRLGSIYEKGVGADRDDAKARRLYQTAAESGNARAMHNLAVMCAQGDDGKPDYRTASDWFHKAAELGLRDSQYNLAVLYARGLGVDQNLALSYMWFAVAAGQGDADAAKMRDEIGGRLDSKELAKAKQLFENFKPRQPKPEANDVAAPKGGWESPKAQTLKPNAKPLSAPPPAARPKVSEM
jgi:localization factor PodJL